MQFSSPSGTVLVIGALGQIGHDLVRELRLRYNTDKVLAADIRPRPEGYEGPYQQLDALNLQAQIDVIREHGVSTIYNLAAILSAKGEKEPQLAWKVNMEALLNSLEAIRQSDASRLFWPSSIAVFGETSPHDSTPQRTVMEPVTVYGISKLAGERWCEYYHEKYGMDVRSIRYPGLIGFRGKPGGGTTDYAVDVFHHALRRDRFSCFLAEETELPMMYMPDAIRATIELMEAPAEKIHIRSSYNLFAMSFTPEQLFREIQRHLPAFSWKYEPDFRQQIAGSWPGSIDDSYARRDWGWEETYDMPTMVKEMISQLRGNEGYVLPELEGEQSS